jgi:hypothetical protein
MRHMNTVSGSGSRPIIEPAFLIGCGILSRELRSVIRKNGWPLETVLLDANLHNDYGSLENSLASTLTAHCKDNAIVFYGCCHPRIDEIVAGGAAVRTHGQNCVEMLLGPELFTRELEAGAYFLFESWARNWNRIICSSFGTTHPEVIQAIFREDRRYLLAVRTPCSGDFTVDAENASQNAGLPLRWMDASLDHLEQTLRDAIDRQPDRSAR